MKIAAVGDICEQIRGVTYAKSDARDIPQNGYTPILRANNIRENGRLLLEDFVFVPNSKISPKQRVMPNDVVVAASSGSISVVGKTAQVQDGFDGGFGAFCKVLRPNPGVAPRYFGHYFRTQAYRRIVSHLAAGANINNLKNEHLDNLQIPLPPLAEQKRIAAILDAADALRAKRRESLKQLDTLLQSTFLEMFGDPVTNPMGWETRKVDEICRLVRGSSPRPKGDPQFYGGPIPRLMVGDITRDGFWVTPRIDSLTEVGASMSRPVPAGTVVMAVSGNVGVVATVQVPCCVHDGFAAFLDLSETDFDSRFFMFQLHFLKTTHEQRKAGAIFQNITTTDIKAMRLPAPPLELQHRLATIVESVEQQKATQHAHLEELDTLFAALQHHAFAGTL
jgi:type I restriction enzyme, S subunit